MINLRNYTVRNYEALGTGWTYDDAGVPQLSTDTDDYAEVTIVANLQPYLGWTRKSQDGGSVSTHRIKAYVQAVAGVFPDIIPASNALKRRGSLLSYNGEWYEIQLVKVWSQGLLPHLYIEGELLVGDLGNGPGASSATWEA